jgi:hypothetical protein
LAEERFSVSLYNSASEELLKLPIWATIVDGQTLMRVQWLAAAFLAIAVQPGMPCHFGINQVRSDIKLESWTPSSAPSSW